MIAETEQRIGGKMGGFICREVGEGNETSTQLIHRPYEANKATSLKPPTANLSAWYKAELEVLNELGLKEATMGRARGATLGLWADDYDKAIKFYREQTQLFSVVANLALGPNNRNVVLAYSNPTAPFDLVVYLATNPAMSALVGRQGGDRPLFVLPVDDCVGTYERLRQAGVEFIGEPIGLPYGCQVTLIDPFGNRVCLSEMYG